MAQFIFEGKDLHKLNQTLDNFNYSVQLSTSKYSFSLPQLPFLSVKAFNHFKHSIDPFTIPITSKASKTNNFSESKLIQYFDQLVSLFHSSTELTVNEQNVEYFHYLSKVLDNRYLEKLCLLVKSFNRSKIFKLTSLQLKNIPNKELKTLNNFNLFVKKDKIKINYSLFSCVSDKFLQMKESKNEIIFSKFPHIHMKCFESFLALFKGFLFLLTI
jgi:hypothetical protein